MSNDRQPLNVDVGMVYHTVLAFTEHVMNRKLAVVAGDEQTAAREATEAANAWFAMQEALGVRTPTKQQSTNVDTTGERS